MHDNKVVNDHKTLICSNGHDIDFTETIRDLFVLVRWNWLTITFQLLSNVVGNHLFILVETQDVFALICWCDANVAESINVVVGFYLLVFLIDQWVLVGHLAKLVNLDLPRSWINALTQFLCHELSRADESEPSAVDIMIVTKVCHGIFERVWRDTSVNIDIQIILEISFNHVMGSGDLEQQFCFNVCNSNFFVRILFSHVCGCLNTGISSTDDED